MITLEMSKSVAVQRMRVVDDRIERQILPNGRSLEDGSTIALKTWPGRFEPLLAAPYMPDVDDLARLMKSAWRPWNE